ncbi:nuclear transport factor 2 family protein [Actinoplanes xinjiangensis]|uniref:Ketosteroid isomerase-like protein n=1 Tax=Actinoplanes xinjiangensis TaxID=512350 RepID=A0A316FTQ0_9ACTN|nr:nuclear transport factor 2 family protein [Actinoplanes xinjiangensis]PWK52104.1 ketosteroid isomerase-like protein [Actinoplanes xinjiangensis]GIF37191.1 ketosteroid isomerase [Actinoplanes xinjiangensis]
MNTTTPPVAVAARAAMRAVTAGDRDAWLACYADDAVLHDPVGGSPLDPQGAGIHGRDAFDGFWRLAIAPNQVRFDIAAVHAAGAEAAVVATVTTTFADGAVTHYDGVFVYAINDDGRIASMRAYWDVRRMLSARKA